MKFGPGVLGVEPPLDGGLGGVAFLNQSLDFPPEARLRRGVAAFKQERDSTLNSISAMFNQLPCLGV